MKRTNSSFRTIAFTLLCLVAFASAGFAKTNPLSYPKGLAIDSQGNLWVANSGDNNVIVFNDKYKQETADTITQGISNPTGVAFDAQGNLWVANYGTSNGGANGSVSEYTAGKQNTAASITNGILGPNAIAVDGLGNVWVENDYVNVTVYDSTFPYAPQTNLLRTISTGASMYGITVGDGTFVWGGNNATSFISATTALVSGGISGYYFGDSAFAVATDGTGQVYMGDFNGTVNIASPLGYEYGPFAQLSFTPTGIAVDNVRGRVYISNANANQILVYSTAGALLKTIE